MTQIAVVDDDENLIRLVTVLFADRGWTVIPCTDPVPALDTIRTQRPDLVMLDVVMASVYTGWKVLQLLKQDIVTRNIPVLVCTGLPDLGDKQVWLNDRGIETLSKPFTVDELYGAVDAALGIERETTA
jgi:CheY-like chemotaxis protein